MVICVWDGRFGQSTCVLDRKVGHWLFVVDIDGRLNLDVCRSVLIGICLPHISVCRCLDFIILVPTLSEHVYVYSTYEYT